jgi:hypothetical protein
MNPGSGKQAHPCPSPIFDFCGGLRSELLIMRRRACDRGDDTFWKERQLASAMIGMPSDRNYKSETFLSCLAV